MIIQNENRIGNAKLVAVYLFLGVFLSFIRVVSLSLHISALDYPLAFPIKIFILILILIKNNNINIKFLLFIFFLFLGIFIDLLSNTIAIPHFYQNIIAYGILTMFLLSYEIDYKELMNQLKKLSIFSILLYLLMMIFLKKSYFLLYDYMDFGFTLIMPSLIVLISYIYERKIKYLIYWIISIILILLFGNRSPVLMTLLSMIFMIKYLKVLERWLLFLVIVIPIIFLKPVVLYLYNFKIFTKMRIMQKLWHYVDNSMVTGLGSGRGKLEEIYFGYIKDAPIFGNGFQKGLLKQGLGNYSHNIIIDFLYNFGIIFGALLLIALCIKIIITFKNNHNIYMEQVLILFLGLSTQLLFSNYYIENFYFYLLLGGILYFQPQASNTKIKHL